MLRLDFEWEAAEGVKCAELRATWARLMISVNGQKVSEVYDLKSHSVRSALYLPLYPLAEWFASNWFVLFCESEVPEKADSSEFGNRHGLRSAAEGFALPELEIVSEEQEVCIGWKSLDLSHMGLRFLASGEERVNRDDLRNSLTQFIDEVISRLESEGVAPKTFLQEEWESVRALEPEEIEFCEIAASLGVDPFSLERKEENEIIATCKAISSDLRKDFFLAASPNSLKHHLDWVSQSLRETVSFSAASDILPDLRKYAHSSFAKISTNTAWDHGYKCAQRLRKYLGFANEPLLDGDYDTKLGYESAKQHSDDQVNFDALTVRDAKTQLGGFVLSGKLKSAQRFAFARALFEYLTSEAAQSLVTRAVTHRQRQNRAFAAELLAPAESLRKRLPRGKISHQTIDSLADEFDVSPYVIGHQIENHRLGTIVTT